MVITLYMSATVAFVFFSFTEEVNLVRDDFYETASQYDQRKAQIERGNSDLAKIAFVLNEKSHQLKIIRSDRSIDLLELVLYRPESGRYDQKKVIRFPADQDQALVNLSDIRQGKWTIKARWMQGGLNYTKEKKIWIR